MDNSLDNPPDRFRILEDTIESPFYAFIQPIRLLLLNLQEEEMVYLKGKFNSEVICKIYALDPFYTVRDEDAINISPLTIRNLRCKLGDKITLWKFGNFPVPNCDTLTLSFIADQPALSNVIDEQVKPYFLANENIVLHVRNVFKTSSDFSFLVVNMKPQSFGKINYRTTRFLLTNQLSEEQYLNEVSGIGFSDIGGYKLQIQQARQLIQFPIVHPEIYSDQGVQPPRGIIICGPPGTGKTMLVKAVSNETNAKLIIVSGPEFLSDNIGENEDNLRKIFQRAIRSRPCVIFFDHLESIAPNRDEAHGQYQIRIVSQLLTMMDSLKKLSQIVIIGSSNKIDRIDPALRSGGRFDKEIYFDPPTAEERLEILQILTRNMKFAEDLNLRKIAKETHGYVGSDLNLIVSEAVHRQVDLCSVQIPSNTTETVYCTKFHELFAITYEDFKFAMMKVHPSALRETFVANPSVKWSQIGGLDQVKEELRELIELPVKYPELFQQLGQTAPKGILLFGPPGCGKTLLAKAIATECKPNFIAVKGPELLTMYFGESAQNVRRLFTWARNSAPCVLFFDELDSATQTRGGSDQCCSEAARVVTQLLVEMDRMEPNNNVFIVAATNRPDIIDSAILRPGRIDQLVYVPLPDFDARVGILRATLQDTFVSPEVNVNNLAEATKGFSGADLAELCRRATRQQIQNGDPNTQFVLTNEHLHQALNQVQRSVSDMEAKKYDQVVKLLRRKRGI